MKLLPTPQYHITLFVGSTHVRVFWTSNGVVQSAQARLSPIEMSPANVFKAATETMKAASLAHYADTSVWRVVLAGGYYAVASRPVGRWSTDLAAAAAAELEPLCPVAFDDLKTAAVPISTEKTLVVGYPKDILESWIQAAAEINLELEGVWTCAAALVEYVIESQHPMGAEPLVWQDGALRVHIEPLAATGSSGSNIENVRVYASPDPTAAHGFSDCLKVGCENDIGSLPGAAAHMLGQIDPSESLNLLRANYESTPVKRAAQRPLLAAAVTWVGALVTLTLGNLVSARASNRQAQASQSEIARVWHSAEENKVLPALPVGALEQEVSNWQAAHDALPALATRRQRLMRTWAMLISHVPNDVTISVSSIRSRGQEFWIDGQIKSQDQARKLEVAWGTLPDIKADPMRLSSNAGDLVNFSVRMVTR